MPFPVTWGFPLKDSQAPLCTFSLTTKTMWMWELWRPAWGLPRLTLLLRSQLYTASVYSIRVKAKKTVRSTEPWKPAERCSRTLQASYYLHQATSLAPFERTIFKMCTTSSDYACWLKSTVRLSSRIYCTENYDLRGPEGYSCVESPTPSPLDCETSVHRPLHTPTHPPLASGIPSFSSGICVPSARFRRHTISVC